MSNLQHFKYFLVHFFKLLNFKSKKKTIFQIKFFTLSVFIFLFHFEVIAQTCCTNEVKANQGFETTSTLNSKFPNATITLTNNSSAITNSVQGNSTGLGGWYLGVAAATATNAFLINDASRASEGSQFWYMPKANNNTGNNNSICLSNTTPMTTTANVCTLNNLKPGKRYITAMDYAPLI
jgi:hypothetical protein